MAGEYDLVIMGSGTAAMVAAMRVREEGWRADGASGDKMSATCRSLATNPT